MPVNRNLLKRVNKLEQQGVREPVEMSGLEVIYRTLDIMNSADPADAIIKGQVKGIIGEIEHESTEASA